MRGAAENIGKAMNPTTHGISNESAKVKDLKKDICPQTSNDLMTSDFGVRQSNTDNWLSASTSDRQGPALLEDNWAREKVNFATDTAIR